MAKSFAQPKKIPCTDEVMLEVWRNKDELSASYGHDLDRLFDYLRRRQKRSGHRVVNLQKPAPANAKPAAPAKAAKPAKTSRKSPRKASSKTSPPNPRPARSARS